MKLHFRRPGEQRTRGQAMVEFAIILPVLALLLVMAVDFGRVFFGWVALNNMARAGSNFAAVHPGAWGSPGNANDRATYQTEMQNDATAINCTGWTSPLPTPSFINVVGTNDPHELGDSSEVRLTCRFSLITPLASNILGGGVTISADAVFPIRTGTVNGVPVSTAVPTAVPTASPTATPTPSATPSASPSLGPGQCQVPSFIGDPHNDSALAQKWTVAGFSTNGNKFTVLSGAWTTVGSQTLVAGSVANCNSAQITVGP